MLAESLGHSKEKKLPNELNETEKVFLLLKLIVKPSDKTIRTLIDERFGHFAQKKFKFIISGTKLDNSFVSVHSENIL